MTRLVLHKKTEREIKILLSSKPQSILIVGVSGIGKKSIAKVLAEQLLNTNDLNTYPYSLTIRSENNKAIGIEFIRSLEHFLSLKVPLDSSPNRAALILDSDKLTHEAQNALLKTLEEPPKDAVIILSASHDGILLPTIRSRMQTLNITPPTENELKDHFKNVSDKEFNKAYLISGGLPGILNALIENEDHPLLSATDDARSILSKTQYERMLMINDLAKDTPKLLSTLQIMEQMAQISLERGANPKQWTKVLQASYEAYVDLSKNAQTKLTLLKLMFSL